MKANCRWAILSMVLLFPASASARQPAQTEEPGYDQSELPPAADPFAIDDDEVTGDKPPMPPSVVAPAPTTPQRATQGPKVFENLTPGTPAAPSTPRVAPPPARTAPPPARTSPTPARPVEPNVTTELVPEVMYEGYSDYEGAECETCPTDGACAVGGECGDEVFRLFDDCCFLQSRGLNIHGWVSQGYTANGHTPDDRFNGPVSFNDRANEYQLNQLYAVLEKPIDLDNCGWGLGGRVDLLYGTDHRFTTSRGLDAERSDGSPTWNSGRFYGLALPQAYGEVAYNDFSLKLGHFYTIIGYEVVTAPDNFFYSHSYSMQYGEPFTHTGALGSYKFNDQFSISAGYTNGWDTFDDVNGDQSFLGGVTFASSDQSHKLAFAITSGGEPSFDGNIDNRTMYSIVYTNVMSDRFTYVFQHDNGLQTELSDGGTNDAEWYSINQYLIYQINCCWSAGLRAEWFRDDDGARVAPAGDFGDNSRGVNTNVASAGGFEGNFFGISAGLNYKPSENLRFRPELRYDVFDGRGTNGVLPYDSGTDDSQFLAAFDVVYLW